MNKAELIDIAMQQCAIELNCNACDFKKNSNILTVPKINHGRRVFISGNFFFRMITFGENAVISADERIHGWLSDYIKEISGHCLFEETHQIAISRELEKYNKPLWMTTHSYLPIFNVKSMTKIAEVKWFEEDQIPQLYADDRFHNALQYKRKPQRPDVLVAASYNGPDEITGMAGASADTKNMWQIGIDVIPEYRSKGLATYLVTLLKNEIVKRGKIP